MCMCLKIPHVSWFVVPGVWLWSQGEASERPVLGGAALLPGVRRRPGGQRRGWNPQGTMSICIVCDDVLSTHRYSLQ